MAHCENIANFYLVLGTSYYTNTQFSTKDLTKSIENSKKSGARNNDEYKIFREKK